MYGFTKEEDTFSSKIFSNPFFRQNSREDLVKIQKQTAKEIVNLVRPVVNLGKNSKEKEAKEANPSKETISESQDSNEEEKNQATNPVPMLSKLASNVTRKKFKKPISLDE